MRKDIKRPLWSFAGFNFLDAWKEEEDTSRSGGSTSATSATSATPLSLQDFADTATNRTDWLLQELEHRFDRSECGKSEVSHPNVATLLQSGNYHAFNAIGRVDYFGLMQEAVTERIAYEIRQRDANGDGPILEDMGDPWSASASWVFWANFLELMNYQHDCQVGYAGDE